MIGQRARRARARSWSAAARGSTPSTTARTTRRVGEPPYRLDCDCRKPRPGLLRRAAEEFDIDLARCWMVGDRYSDTELARNAGVRAAFVLSGYGRGEWEHQRHAWKHQPDLVAENLLEAVRGITNE